MANRKPRIDTSLPPEPKQPNTWGDMVMSGLAGVGRGLEGVVGLPGDIQSAVQTAVNIPVHAYRTGMQYLWDKGHGRDASWGSAGAKVDARDRAYDAAVQRNPVARVVNRMAQPLNTANTSNAVDAAIRTASGGNYTGLYQPKTRAGRLTQDVAMGTTGALVPGGGVGKLASAGVGAASGLAGGAARETVHSLFPDAGPGWETAAQIAGSLLGGGTAGAAASYRRAPTRGQTIAARGLQEASLDPAADAERLRSFSPPSGFSPTSGQVLRTPGAAATESRIIANAAKPRERALAAQRAAAREQATSSVIPGAPRVGVAGEYPDIFAPGPQGTDLDALRAQHAVELEAAQQTHAQNLAAALPGNQAAAGVRLQQHLEDVYGRMSRAEDARWGDVRDSGITLRGPHPNPAPGAPPTVVDDLDEYMNGLGVVRRPEAAWAERAIQRIKSHEWPNGEIPISEWQDLRSGLLAEGQNAKTGFGQRVYKDLADRVAAQLENPKFVNFPTPEAEGVWRQAVDATREKHRLFSDTGAGQFVERDVNGNLVRAPEETVAGLLGGSKGSGTQNVRALLANENLDPDLVGGAFAEHYAGALTNNGANPAVTLEKIAKLRGDTQAGPLSREVAPIGSAFDAAADAIARRNEELDALVARHSGEVQQAQAANAAAAEHAGLREGFENAYQQSPEALRDYIAVNREALRSAVHPQFDIDALHSNLDTISRPEGAGALNTPTLDTLYNDTGDSTIAGDALGAGASFARAAAHPGIHSLTDAVTRAWRGVSNRLSGNANRYAREALEGAVASPEAYAGLLERPTDVPSFRRPIIGAATMQAITPQAPYYKEHERAVPLSPEVDSNSLDLEASPAPSNPAFDPDSLDMEPVREHRASGGKVGGIEHLVERLMTRAKHAKKATTKHTEPLLNHDDSAIVSALRVAKQAI